MSKLRASNLEVKIIQDRGLGGVVFFRFLV